MTKAVVAAAPGATPVVREVELPPTGPGDVRVRVTAAGVCHSDLSMINGTFTPQFPLVLGHEAAGVVSEAGEEVATVAAGDRVALNWAPACRQCWFCARGEPWLCAAVAGVVSVPKGVLDDGTPAHSCLGVGAFAEEVVVPARAAVRLPDGLPLDLAGLLGCAVLTGVGAVRNTARVQPGESVLVIGQGGVGLAAVLGARLAGAHPIIAADVTPGKEALARAAGATDFLASDETLPKRVRALTGGRGADHAFECVGAAPTIRAAWDCARRGGQCVVVGVGPRDQQVSFAPLELFHFARTLTSSVYGASDPDADIPRLAQEVRGGALDLASLVTHRITLADVPEAFARMRAGQGARSLIVMAPPVVGAR